MTDDDDFFLDRKNGCDISGSTQEYIPDASTVMTGVFVMKHFKMNCRALCLTESERTALLYIAVEGLRRFRYFGGVTCSILFVPFYRGCTFVPVIETPVS